MQPVHLDRYENYSSALKDSLYCVLLGKGVLVCCAYPTSQLLGTHYRGSTGRVPCLDRMLPCCKEHRSALLSSLPGTRILAKHQGKISESIQSPQCPWLSSLNPREEGCHDHRSLLPGPCPGLVCCWHIRRRVTCLSQGLVRRSTFLHGH